jgi:hypothetical protein
MTDKQAMKIFVGLVIALFAIIFLLLPKGFFG